MLDRVWVLDLIILQAQLKSHSGICTCILYMCTVLPHATHMQFELLAFSMLCICLIVYLRILGHDQVLNRLSLCLTEEVKTSLLVSDSIQNNLSINSYSNPTQQHSDIYRLMFGFLQSLKKTQSWFRDANRRNCAIFSAHLRDMLPPPALDLVFF